MYRILIVEDDSKIASIVKGHLLRYDYEVVVTEDFSDIKGEVVKQAPSLVLLDINLPHYDGFYWCRQIRTISNVPIIFLSARAGEMDQVLAIENGGDDYITKPFSLEVVLAKVKGVLRRTYGEYSMQTVAPSDIKEIEGLFLNSAKNEVEWDGRAVTLTRNEFQLLSCLLNKAGAIVAREDLLEALWDDVDFVDDNTLSVNVNRVRKKLGQLGIEQSIETVRGQGYRLNVTWGKS